MKASSISIREFRQMLQSCRPPSGWGNLIAVAHSGGADSTCLIYLLHRLLSLGSITAGESPGLLSLSVDHALQPGSAATAEHCRRLSESLNVPHVTLRIPWSCPPFPNLPEAGRPFESIARSARYRLLLEGMQRSNSTVIAMGHHADDHVETLLMRLARNNSGAIPMGIRNCRRWGMGSNLKALDWAGPAGMHRWVVRPLLEVSKDRILATCEQHGLKYLDDATNFQPSLTTRNHVRHFLSKYQKNWKLPYQNNEECPGGASCSVDNLHGAIRRLGDIATEPLGLLEETTLVERLRSAANALRRLRDKTDKEVTQYLKDVTRPSPPSTLLFCPPCAPLPPLEMRRAIVLRILRFVSPRPWGAPVSEASRKSSSLDIISGRLWNLSPETKQVFCAGGEVIWRPVSLRGDGRVRLVIDDRTSHQMRGWLASRQPPIKRTGAPSPCLRDIQVGLSGPEELLWDNRFLIRLRPHLLPRNIRDSCQSTGSVVTLPHGRWLLPKIVWSREGDEGVVLGGVGLDVKHESMLQGLNADWARFRWARPLDAI